MRHLAILLAAGTLHAAVIRGVVVEHSSGKPLARAQITVAPLPGTQGSTQTLRTNTYGNFECAGLAGGAFIVSAARRGFPPVQYGQKSWRGAGAPLVLAEDQSTFITIRMPRYGGITGVIVDENDTGMPEHEVVAMSNSRPPRVAGRAKADERGVFRISGLMPGRYLVRTIERLYEDGGYLPTFSRETLHADDAAVVDVDLDRDTDGAHVRPIPGALHAISSTAVSCIIPPPGPPPFTLPVTVTLANEMGRETASTFCPGGTFSFANRAPGPYEIFAATEDGQGAYIRLTLEDRDWEQKFPLLLMASVYVSFRGPQGKGVDYSSVALQMRRVDLAGESPIEKEKIMNGRGRVIQGRWQFQLVPNPQYVAVDFRGCRTEERSQGYAAGWNEVVINQRTCNMTYILSSHPSAVRGTVTFGNNPVGGAPVFLEPWDTKDRKRLGDPLTARSDMQGRYELTGLAPGTYRLVSTFEYLNPEVVDIDEMRPHTVVIEEGRDQQQDLDLWVIR
jgi:hypothetical protein